METEVREGNTCWLNLVLHLVGFSRAEHFLGNSEDILKTTFRALVSATQVHCHLLVVPVSRAHQYEFCTYMETSIFKLNHVRSICQRGKILQLCTLTRRSNMMKLKINVQQATPRALGRQPWLLEGVGGGGRWI